MSSARKKVLVTGGNGFIGGHVARKLDRMQEYCVRVVDVVPAGNIVPTIDYVQGDLLDPAVCARVVEGVDIVMHFAANMGGMGIIHEANDLLIYEQNHRMTLNILSTAKAAGVQKFFYASSACVYPSCLQGSNNQDVALGENDVWTSLPPNPQGLYGLEKLDSEGVLLIGGPPIEIFIARFHNVFGPHGSWRDGREKAPAAFLRKVLAAKRLGLDHIPLEMWGNGAQRRSFCYIDDAVKGVIALLHSRCHTPVNIGSDRGVSMAELATIAASAVGLDPSQIKLECDLSKPVGVAARNSDNAFVRSELNWSPAVTLEEGMRLTGEWIDKEMQQSIFLLSPEDRANLLRQWQTSKVIHLTDKTMTYAILIPITSRTTSGGSSVACLESLARFADSLKASKDEGTEQGFDIRVYLAIDHDDEVLHVEPVSPAEMVLRAAGIEDIVTLVCQFPRGHVCSLWRHLARRAWRDGCQYFVLMGDDVVLPPNAKGWMSLVHKTFAAMSAEFEVPHGFGCVAFTDVTFPGMPTFPVVHRTHLDIFDGQVVPDVFVNQDGDPFLFQLYRRFGCSTMISSPIHNTLGGSEDARYEKLHAKSWTFGPLDEATSLLTAYLGPRGTQLRMLTIDIIVPCYRVNLDYLERFLTLRTSPKCSSMFIIIVDDPRSPNIMELQHTYGHRWDVRIRINRANSGASASRNRGLQESAAEWVLFLDDDVVPQRDILLELEKCIRDTPKAAGFVGNACFPLADSVTTAAIHLAGVTYFWNIARKMPEDHDVPWGVTANLAARRNVRDGVSYDPSFPKTGGGEDIDYCRRKRQYSLDHGGDGFVAAPKVVVTHPYWNNGKRSYWRFYMWSKGDGALIKLHPKLTYVDWAPNSSEILLCCVFFPSVLGLAKVLPPTSVALLGVQLSTSVILGNIVHDTYRHLWMHRDRTAFIETTVDGVRWLAAVLESAFIRMFSEMGRLMGMLERREYLLLGRRFDWFAGHPSYGGGPVREERRNSLERLCMSVLFAAIIIGSST